jgi:hypothetical protein
MITRAFSPRGLVAVGILCIIVLASLCSSAVAQTVTSSDYFPLTPGTKWSYIVNDKDTVKCSVLKEKVKVGGVETSVIYYPQRNIKQNYTSDSQGIRLHQMPIEDLCIDYYGCFDLTVTLSPPIVLAGGTMDVGQTFKSSGIAKTNSLPYVGSLELPYSASFTFEGFETVSVPAATFYAARLSGSYTIAGETIGDILFLAQDLGVAKRINEYEGTFTWELQSTTAGFVRLLTPGLGEVLEAGEIYDIAWEASEDAARFSLSHSIDNGVTWSAVDGAENLTDTSFEWIVPPQPGNKKKCLVKLTGYNDAEIKVEEDISEPFTIEVVELISPNGGGQPLTSGISYPIEWMVNETIRPVESIQLSYTTDGGKKWKPVGPSLAGDATTHEWLVPLVKKTKAQCKVKVVLMDKDGKKVGNDVSDSFFTIQQP